MKNDLHTDPPAKTPNTESENWDALYERIRKLAHARAGAMTGCGDEDAFDRGARALRTLMGAAEISRRMKTAEEKETAPDGKAEEPVISDQRIEEVYRAVARSVDRVADRRGKEADRRGDHAPGLSGTGGEALETERS